MSNPETFVITVPNASVVQIPAPFSKTTKLMFGLSALDTITYRALAVVEKASATITSFGAASAVTASATSLDGTSGTDVIVHFSGSILQVANRSGSSRTFVMTIYPAL